MAFTDINDERGALDIRFFIFVWPDQPREGREQRERQIVHTKITEVLEGVGRGRHP
jgi:hypothetical protein